jgi:octanoyl-[GcvH]:protein N-octanoyltransferase
MQLLLPDRFQDARTGYGYVRTIFDQVASGTRPATVSITPSTRHVGVTRRDTFRPGFADAVEAAGEMGYPVLVRSSGGGATAADLGTFGFSIIRPADERESNRGIKDRYEEAASFVLAVFSRLGVKAEVGEVRDEFCPGDHSVRVGDRENGMKIVGIAQRITRRATSVGGIVLVEGERELARVLGRVYGAMHLPFRPESVGSLRLAGYEARTPNTIEAFAAEAERTYGAIPAPLDEKTLAFASSEGEQYLIEVRQQASGIKNS